MPWRRLAAGGCSGKKVIVFSHLFTLQKPYHTKSIHLAGQIITTSAEVTLNGGLRRELPQNPLNSGLGIILICPDLGVEPKIGVFLGPPNHFFFLGGGLEPLFSPSILGYQYFWETSI